MSVIPRRSHTILRLTIKDDQGEHVTSADVVARVIRGDTEIATVSLSHESDGMYEGVLEPIDPDADKAILEFEANAEDIQRVWREPVQIRYTEPSDG